MSVSRLLILFCLGWVTSTASWYDPKPRHMRMWGSQYVAAHRTFRPGTRLEVVNVYNGKRVSVIVVGRGPFVRGRGLDLSRHAFRRIELPSRGLVKVRYRVLRRPLNKRSQK